jgi:hypothetical protein
MVVDHRADADTQLFGSLRNRTSGKYEQRKGDDGK